MTAAAEQVDDEEIVPLNDNNTASNNAIITIPSSDRRAKWEETILFFLSAVGCTLGWTAVLSNLVYYTETLGVNSYVILNLCIYAPLFPITLAQALYDADFDRKFTSLRTFWVRGSVGFGVTLASTVLLASASKRQALWKISLLSLCLGTASGVLHGALKQMASFVYPGCGRLAAAVTAGLQASAVFVLVVSLATPKSVTTSLHWLHCFYGAIAVLVGVCWLGFQRLMTHSRDVYRSMLRRDSSIQLSAIAENQSDEEEEEALEYHEAGDVLRRTNTAAAVDEQKTDVHEDDEEDNEEHPLLQATNSADSEDSCCRLYNNNNSDQPLWWTLSPMMKDLLKQSWPLCVAIFLTVSSSMGVASWFNRVPSDHHPQTLPQVLFYTRLFADLLARPATLWLPQQANLQHTLWYLLALVGIRLLFVPYFFLYTTTHYIPRSDWIMTLGVFGFAFSSGFVTTWAYQLAPRFCRRPIPEQSQRQQQQAPEQQRQSSSLLQQQNVEEDATLLLQQTNLLNVCFSASVLLGLMGSLSLSGMKMA